MTISPRLSLIPGRLALGDIRAALRGPIDVHLDPITRDELNRNATSLTAAARGQEAVYGLNTGFGKLARTRIPPDKLSDLQRNLVLSHAAGVGDPLHERTVRLILLLKANGLSRGHSGVRADVVEALIALLKRNITPVIPAKGSVGASGDLAPLAHLALVLIGEGSARVDGKNVPGRAALRLAGLEPLTLGPKEGLALLNGTQVSTAIALTYVLDAEELLQASLIIGALSVDAAKGSDTPFDPRIHELRGHRGQEECAAAYRYLLSGSAIRASHVQNDDRVQDPYCLRCQPQVVGACLDQLRYVVRTLEVEANAVSDNPIHFPATGELLSGGNFHGEPVAFAADAAAVAIAELGSLSERRIALLVDTTISGLPPFLIRDGGLNSGFMIAHVTAAALTSENKSLAHPASVDSIPTSANQEDHVSMATFAARRLGEMVANTRVILAIEYLAAVQGVEFNAPLATSAALRPSVAALRTLVPTLHQDREFSPDILAAESLIRNGTLARTIDAGRLPTCSTSA